MERLLTKCCWATSSVMKDDNGYAIKVYCDQCEVDDPHMEWVEMCHHCKKPARYCECP